MIMLKGMWLKELGFDIGDYISVTCEDGKLIITLDTERAAMKAAVQPRSLSCKSRNMLRRSA